jgi:hypothetical protein
MDNHLHLLLRLDPKKSREWSAEEVARRWMPLFPLRNVSGQAIKVAGARIAIFAAEPAWVEEMRRRLGGLGRFVKCLYFEVLFSLLPAVEWSVRVRQALKPTWHRSSSDWN